MGFEASGGSPIGTADRGQRGASEPPDFLGRNIGFDTSPVSR